MSLPSSYNPSDYEYLLRSLTEANLMAKAQSLKRFNALATSDRKQFSPYAKRIVLSLQDLLLEPKEDINLLAAMLVLQIINVNPRDIEYYIKSKVLRQTVLNLGDSKPQVRKTSHYCLLAYAKTFRSLDQLLSIYMELGFSSPEAQLRQKTINSFQSMVITDAKVINWNSMEFKKVFEALLQKLKDGNPYVQRAAEQCLLTLSKLEPVTSFTKKLTPTHAGIYRLFCQKQKELGNLTDVNRTDRLVISQKSLLSTPTEAKPVEKVHRQRGFSQAQRDQLIKKQQLHKQAVIDRIHQIKRKAETPKDQPTPNPKLLLRKQTPPPKPVVYEIQESEPEPQPLPPPKKQIIRSESEGSKLFKLRKEAIDMKEPDPVVQKPKQKLPPVTVREPRQKREPPKSPKKAIVVEREMQSISMIRDQPKQKPEQLFSRKLLEELRNEKDWKVRLEAIEQLSSKFQLHKQAIEMQPFVKYFVPALVKLLSDTNFKIAFMALKVVQELLVMPMVTLDQLVPQIIDRLADNKVALRQNVSKLVRSQYLTTFQPIWIDGLLELIRRQGPGHHREQGIGVLTRLYEAEPVRYPLDKVIDAVCPLMDDPKTKIKIKTLQLLVLITIKTKMIDTIKSILISQMNQVYYEMFVQKLGKQMKALRGTPELSEANSSGTSSHHRRDGKTVAFPTLRKNKTSANNSTSTSLQKYSRTTQTKPITRTNSIGGSLGREKVDRGGIRQKVESMDNLSRGNLIEDFPEANSIAGHLTPNQGVRKKPLKNYKRKLQKTLQSKLMTNFTNQTEQLKPLADPHRQLANIQNDIKSDDWQMASDALTKLRRLIFNHGQMINAGVARQLSVEVVKHVQSLRSSLCKNAVMTIGQLAQVAGKALDPELDLIYSKLMRKTLDTNSFISEQVRKSLISVSTNCNGAKVMSILNSFHTARAVPIKQNVLSVLETISHLQWIHDKEMQRVVQILVDFMGEGALQIRERTKKLLGTIIDGLSTNSKAYRLISQPILTKIKGASVIKADTEPVKTATASVIIKDADSEVDSEPRKKKKISVFPDEFQELDELLRQCSSGDWKNRQESMQKVGSILEQYPQQLTQYKLAPRVMDALSRQINDPNPKVAVAALTLFRHLAPLVPRLLELNLSVIVNEVFQGFASQRVEVRQGGLELFDSIAQVVESWMLVQHLCNGSLYGPVRSRASILVKLLKIMPAAFGSRKSVGRSIYNALNKLVGEAKTQIVPILKELITLSLSLGGDDALSALKQDTKNLLNE